jgi:hypothetical protein
MLTSLTVSDLVPQSLQERDLSSATVFQSERFAFKACAGAMKE